MTSINNDNPCSCLKAFVKDKNRFRGYGSLPKVYQKIFNESRMTDDSMSLDECIFALRTWYIAQYARNITKEQYCHIDTSAHTAV